jgi:sirohydrochlorin cobaltochelatase
VIDNVKEAMDRLVADGVKDVIIQPSHVMEGFEYYDVVADVTPYKEKFNSVKIGASLLASDSDYDKIVTIISLCASRTHL